MIRDAKDASRFAFAERQFEVIADKFSRHAALIIGALCVLVSLALRWIDFPITKDFSSVRIPILQNLEASPPRACLFSYGVLAAVLLPAGLVARRWWAGAWCAAGTALLALALLSVLQVACSHPSTLRRLASEEWQYEQIRKFASTRFPVKADLAPKPAPHRERSAVTRRLAAAWSFHGAGWHLQLAGATLVFFGGLHHLRGRRGKAAVISGIALAALAIVFIAKPIAAQLQFERGALAHSRGDPRDALARFERALHLDRWHVLGPEGLSEIGRAREGLRQEGSPEWRLHRASVLERRGEAEAALFEYRRAAAEAAGTLRRIGREEAARLGVALGLRDFLENNHATAVSRWEEALKNDPRQFQAAFYLIHGNYELARYDAAIAAGEGLMTNLSNRFVRAGVFAVAGHCYARLEDPTRARASYLKCFRLDTELSNWATNALAGN